MPKIVEFNVEFLDGRTATAKFTPKVQVAVERQFDIAVDSMSKLEHIYYAAYIGLQQKGDLGGVHFDEFLDQVAAVEASEPQEVGPTQPGPLTDDSSPLPS